MIRRGGPDGRTPRAGPRRLDKRPPRRGRVGDLRVPHGRALPRPHPTLGGGTRPCWQGFFSGTPEEYADLLKAAYPRSIAPIRRPWSSAGTSSSSHAAPWTKRGPGAGRAGFHGRALLPRLLEPRRDGGGRAGEPTFIEQEVRHFVDLMRDRGKLRPITMTEAGLRCPPFASWLPKEGSVGGAFRIAGQQLPSAPMRPRRGLWAGAGHGGMFSAGVANVCYYYTGGDRGRMPWFSTMANGYYVLMDYDGRPKPTMMAYSTLERQLDGTSPRGVRVRNGLTVHLFSKGRGAIAVGWSDRERILAIECATVLDLMGNEEQEPRLRPGEPVFVVVPDLCPSGWIRV